MVASLATTALSQFLDIGGTSFAYRRYLDGIAQPALIVNGSNDIVIPTINSYHLYQHLPDAELMLLPDSGHGAHFQYVERFIRRVIDFLDVQPHDTATLG
jgi:pimeloyl-ACP methyl ester carboxylesterase